MSTFYVGARPVLRGRDSDEYSNPFVANTLSGTAKPAVGKYSNYFLYGPGLLGGAPDNDHTIGTGYHPHGLQFSRWYRGLDTKFPMDGAGDGARLTYHRTKMHEYKGLTASGALATASLGHLPNRGLYNFEHYDNFTFDGVTSAEQLSDPGHLRRAVDAAGTANSFGSFDPHVYKGITSVPLSGATQTVPTDYDHEYGKNRVNEWRGVPSSKAL